MTCYLPSSDRVTVLLSSAVFNVLNFLLFDILLASIVFYLTADIAGLVNSASALQQLENRLHAYNPPLVGVGLTCTRRNVFRVLALIRGITMLGVLGTNFLIEGVSCERLQNLERNVLVHGRVDPDAKFVDVRRLTLRRRSCQGRTKTQLYYGELRVNEQCELRKPLFANQNIVHFGLEFVNRTIELPKSECEFYTNNGSYNHVHQYTCKGLGTIACEVSYEDITIPNLCVGVVMADDYREGKEGKKVAYMCEGEALFPGRFGLNRSTDQASCRMAENSNTTDTYWVPIYKSTSRSLRDAFDAVYGAQVKKITVQVTNPNDKMEVAALENGWFWVLGAKGALILLLIVIDLSMRARGLVPAANNEFGLGSLLAQSVADAPEIGEDDLPVTPTLEEIERGETTQLVVQNLNGVLRARSARSYLSTS